jgi:hypothetical protein
MFAAHRSITLCVALCLPACGGATPEKKPQPADAKSQEPSAEEQAAVAARKAKREAEKKAQDEQESKAAAELERLTVLPEKLPRDPVAACEAVGAAHDAYVRRIGDAAAIAAWDGGGKEKSIPMTVVQCTQADSLKAAACQKQALDGAGPELKDQTKKLLQLCIDKFAVKGGGGSQPAGAAMPKKRPG